MSLNSPRQGAVKWPDAINATISGAGTTSVIIPFEGKHAISLTATADAGSTLVGTPSLETSDNYDARRPTAARWVTITDAAILAFFAAAFGTGSGAGGKPNGAAGSGKLQVDPLRAAAVRYNLLYVSGSGAFHLDVEMA